MSAPSSPAKHLQACGDQYNRRVKPEDKLRVVVFGAGYVGLVVAACYAELGHTVRCVDIDEVKIAKLKLGETDIYEPALDTKIQAGIAASRLSFSTELAGVEEADAVVVCVGTANLSKDGVSASEVDISQVQHVIQSIAKRLKSGCVVFLKSTVPPGTAASLDKLLNLIRHRDSRVFLVANPEFSAQGTAVEDFYNRTKIVVGTDSDEAELVAQRLYATGKYAAAVTGDAPEYFIHRVKPASAELMKYSANAFLSLRVSFINEMSSIAEYVNADINEVKSGLAEDARIGDVFFQPGLGFGGYCLPKDLAGLISVAKRYKEDTWFSGVEAANRQQPSMFYNKLIARYGSLSGHTFAFLGLSFKPGTSDIRSSPALVLAQLLSQQEAFVRIHDPHAHCEVITQNVYMSQHESIEQTLKSVTAVIIAVAWPEYETIDFSLFHKEVADPIIFDCCNLYAPESINKMGFSWVGIGRPESILAP